MKFVGGAGFESGILDNSRGTINSSCEGTITGTITRNPIESNCPTFCDNMTITELITSGNYNVIDNRDGSLGTKITGTNNDDLILASNAGDSIRGLDGNDCIIGGDGADLLVGNKGDDQIYGGAENDTIYGKDGDDLIFGNMGNDTLKGGDGNDVIKGGIGRTESLEEKMSEIQIL